jgi:O-Antigen ligase
VKLDDPARAPGDIRAPSQAPDSGTGRVAGLARLVAWAALATGVLSWALGQGILALWLFMAAAVALALVLPLPVALVSPLFLGVTGWLVDMLPLVILAGWATVIARWAWGLIRARRRPAGGRWIWLPIALVAWTVFGVVGVPSDGLKRFALLLAIQVLASGALLAVVDCLRDSETLRRVAAGLLTFVVLLSVAVFLQWIGVPIQELKDTTVSDRVEAAYGVDAFTNSLEMIKYVRSSRAGAPELRADLAELRRDVSGLPEFTVFKPKFQAWRTSLMVQFDGSARPYADRLQDLDISLLYDDVGLAPANNVPRMRSFPRNSLTYAGICAALFPVALYFAWSAAGRRRLLGYIGAASCLFGAAFSLARGSWIALAVGVAYLAVDGRLSLRRKLQAGAAVLAAAVVITGVFFVKYGVDPMSARGEAEGSVNTREELYNDSITQALSSGLYLVVGFGTETPRGLGGSSHVLGRYIPSAGTHSTYLNYLYRTGVPGALMIIAVYVIAALHARAAARASEGDEALFATLLTASVVLVAAHGLILNLYVEPIYTLVIMTIMGLAVAVGIDLRQTVRPWARRPPSG